MKTVALTLLWIAGSAAAIGVAWAGVNVVDDEVIDPAPAVSAPTSTFETAAGRLPESPTPGVASAPDDEIIDADPETGQEPLRPEAAPEPAPTSEPGATPTPSQQPAGTNEPATTPEPQPQATVAPQPTPAPTPPAATPDPESSSTPEPPPPAPAAQTLTFNLVGGSTAISFSASGVQVLWATPNPGFGVEIEPESPGIKVQFESEGHKSRIEAWWSAGPQHEIREEPGG